tara:strand:- start:335 stop:628 length:294 start_codon:yes stop_codon:yes gene_type:complete
MKILKKILALSFFIAFISAGTNANAAMLKNADCSNYKVLSHEWNSCKLGSKKYPPAGETSELANDESGEKSKKKKKFNLNFLKKIREFGGENIGEEG